MSIDDTIANDMAGVPSNTPTPSPLPSPSQPPLDEDIPLVTPEEVDAQLDEVAATNNIDISQQTPAERSVTKVQGAKIAEVQATVSKKVEAGQPVAEAVAETREDYLASADLHDQRAIEILDKMNEGQTLPPEDALAMLFAALIPAMLGAAIGGKAGAAAGFSGASSALLTSLKNDEKNFRAGEKAKAQLELDKAKDIRAQGRILDKEERANEEWERRFAKKSAHERGLQAAKDKTSMNFLQKRKAEKEMDLWVKDVQDEETTIATSVPKLRMVLDAIKEFKEGGGKVSESTLQALVRRYGSDWLPGENPQGAQLSAAINDLAVDELGRIKGNPNLVEGAYAIRAKLLGKNVPVQLLEEKVIESIDFLESRPVLAAAQSKFAAVDPTLFGTSLIKESPDGLVQQGGKKKADMDKAAIMKDLGLNDGR